MARNIEIKARVSDLAPIREKALALARNSPEVIAQTDTFFVVPQGRLKLREFADGSGELISYERPDRPGPKESEYILVPCKSAHDLTRALDKVLPVRGKVSKRREVFLIGRTRVHLDIVETLGSFVELEVVLQDQEQVQAAEREAHELMGKLGIQPTDLIPDAYIDILERASISLQK
jgi:predicted adenylyl cyclase CyaB